MSAAGTCSPPAPGCAAPLRPPSSRSHGTELRAAAEPPENELLFYRERTVALLKRYFSLSIELGRLPSLLGREFFRSRVTSYRVQTFEDAVVFVHDVERCLESLDPLGRGVIGRVIMQDYTQNEAALLLGCTERTVARRLSEAIDELSRLFVISGMIKPLPR